MNLQDLFANSCNKKGIPLGITRIGVHAGSAIVGILVAGGFSTTRPMAIRSMSQRGSKRPIKNSARGGSSARFLFAKEVKDFRGRPIGDLVLRGKGEAMRAFEPLREEQYKNVATKSYFERVFQIRSRRLELQLWHLQRMSAKWRTINLPAFISSDC